MPVRIRSQRYARSTVPVYGRVRAADLPRAMVEPGKREHVPLTFFVREWDAWPDERSAMIADTPTGDDADDLCRIAAVVHALCARDGVPVPAWVFDHRSEVDIAWGRHCVMEGFIWEQTIADAPAACAYHRVWFDREFVGIASQRRRRTAPTSP